MPPVTSSLRPDETVQKLLISTTSHFVGAFERDDMMLALRGNHGRTVRASTTVATGTPCF